MDAVAVPLLRTLGDRARSDHSVLIRVVSLTGFGLRDAGDGLIVDRSTEAPALHGSLLGGLADAAIVDALDGAAKRPDGVGRTAIRVPITDAAADAAGMVCGGTAHLLATPVADLPAGTEQLLVTATPLAVVCRADAGGGDSVVSRRDVLGPSLEDATLEAVRAVLAEGVSQSTVLEGGEWLVATIVPDTEAIVVGSGPMADAIVAQGELLGWRAAKTEDVAVATDFVRRSGPADALIVLSHDRTVDVPLLAEALSSPIGYIGAMGSRGTQTARRRHLDELGFDEASQSRIHGPVGLDLGARSPQETAVAIAAEFLAARSGRAPSSLSAGDGPINR